VRSLLLMTLLLLTCACTGFREGMPGVFRSSFAREEQMIRRIAQNGIRSVLCLRGGRTARQSERATMAGGAEFTSVPISAKSAPRPAALLKLWHVAATAERPIMVHCRAGVDRTGLALAIIALHDTGDFELARDQLAFIPNGHIAAFGTEAMDRVIDDFEPFHEVLSFPAWVERVYTADYERNNATPQ
jgi:protein tyrosine phosphatase (PTP) superfamily phosphohydrolase (DUF442 family)